MKIGGPQMRSGWHDFRTILGAGGKLLDFAKPANGEEFRTRNPNPHPILNQ